MPKDAMDVLQWHVETQLETPEQKASDLLFPAADGRFRSHAVLKKPFAEVSFELGLSKHVTPRAMRRTFNDLARAARVQDVVTRSISGHLTEGMQRHYSTVSGDEQRQALARVIDLTRTVSPANSASPPPAPSGEQGGEPNQGGGEHAAPAR